jgi:hypothetical protein
VVETRHSLGFNTAVDFSPWLTEDLGKSWRNTATAGADACLNRMHLIEHLCSRQQFTDLILSVGISTGAVTLRLRCRRLASQRHPCDSWPLNTVYLFSAAEDVRSQRPLMNCHARDLNVSLGTGNMVTTDSRARLGLHSRSVFEQICLLARLQNLANSF